MGGDPRRGGRRRQGLTFRARQVVVGAGARVDSEFTEWRQQQLVPGHEDRPRPGEEQVDEVLVAWVAGRDLGGSWFEEPRSGNNLL